MKKIILLCASAAIAAGAAGYFAGLNANPDMAKYEFLIEANRFKGKLLDVQYDALQKAETIMDNNGLFDSDGSDDMAEYMELYAKADSLLMTQL